MARCALPSLPRAACHARGQASSLHCEVDVKLGLITSKDDGFAAAWDILVEIKKINSSVWEMLHRWCMYAEKGALAHGCHSAAWLGKPNSWAPAPTSLRALCHCWHTPSSCNKTTSNQLAKPRQSPNLVKEEFAVFLWFCFLPSFPWSSREKLWEEHGLGVAPGAILGSLHRTEELEILMDLWADQVARDPGRGRKDLVPTTHSPVPPAGMGQASCSKPVLFGLSAAPAPPHDGLLVQWDAQLYFSTT